jgi:CheY-like chemotaxis protein
VADLVGPLAAERGIELVTDLDGDPGVHVRADLQRIKQVLLNLLSNAIKYNRDGGRVTVRVRPAGRERTRIMVSDTGHGLRPEDLARAFNPFERLDAANGRTEGTGLGLALSRSLTEAMGGRLTAASEPGIGCDFSVELDHADPIAKPALAPAGPPAEAAAAPRSKQRLRILCVEDNPSNLRLLRRVLSRDGMEVIEAPQGRLALDLAARHLPDVVLLDLDLPDLSGEVVLSFLRADPLTAGIPILICSADATKASMDRLMAAGANGYLTKPLDVDVLLKTIAESADGVVS